MNKVHPPGVMLVLAYSAVCIVAGIQVLRGTGQAELSGIGVFLLGLPWSLILTLVCAVLHLSSAWLLALGYLGSCAINGWFLYRLGARIPW
jgi:hypothetical protein